MRSWPLLIEISAANGRLTLDFTQPFQSPIYLNAFLRELEESGITYVLQDVSALDAPDVSLPWRKRVLPNIAIFIRRQRLITA